MSRFFLSVAAQCGVMLRSVSGGLVFPYPGVPTPGAFGSAPRSSSHCTMSRRPFLAASHSSVRPPSPRRATSVGSWSMRSAKPS
jgi:hypothetical protein